jgi:aspartyl-tRNA(Asn)/glutamyl-tRNA(Gln) amidotransferase subunit C
VSLDRTTVEQIAFLARIRVSDDQLDSLAGELNGILHWVEQLAEVDTTGVEPMTSGADMRLRLRADEITDGDCQAAILANAPQPVDEYFAVPKVVE